MIPDELIVNWAHLLCTFRSAFYSFFLLLFNRISPGGISRTQMQLTGSNPVLHPMRSPILPLPLFIFSLEKKINETFDRCRSYAKNNLVRYRTKKKYWSTYYVIRKRLCDVNVSGPTCRALQLPEGGILKRHNYFDTLTDMSTR